jgi:hypothetical protein
VQDDEDPTIDSDCSQAAGLTQQPRPRFTQHEDFFHGLSKTQGLERLGRLGNLKKSNDFFLIRTRDLLTCGMVSTKYANACHISNNNFKRSC